jgi:ABC-2 type transport system ATP-binding protein
MTAVLTVHQLTKHYGKIQALNSLELTVTKGQVFGLLGPNGSGKTTTLSILLGLLKQGGGSFTWFGEPPSKESRKRIGSVIESPNFFPYLDAVLNLRIVADIKGFDYGDIDRVLHVTGLYERRSSKFRTYSFGMKQRLAVASALLGNPEVLILDEPTNGLDPQGIVQMREIIRDVAGHGITIILASHLLDEVQKICSHVAVLQKGIKLFDGEVSNVLSISEYLELASQDMESLIIAIKTHPGFKSMEQEEPNRLMVRFNGLIDAEEVNRFLFEKRVVLSHLSERKRSLEQHFLELLQDNQC